MKRPPLQAQQRGEDLLPAVYPELRRMAAAKMARLQPGQTLQPTALVHEAWLRLDGAGNNNWTSRCHFFAAAAKAMRCILIDHARRKKTPRHGGHLQRVELTDVATAEQMTGDELVALDEALARLAGEDDEAVQLVELRFFAGLGHQEAAEMMGISRRRADGLWAHARAWLYEEINESLGADNQPISSE